MSEFFKRMILSASETREYANNAEAANRNEVNWSKPETLPQPYKVILSKFANLRTVAQEHLVAHKGIIDSTAYPLLQVCFEQLRGDIDVYAIVPFPELEEILTFYEADDKTKSFQDVVFLEYSLRLFKAAEFPKEEINKYFTQTLKEIPEEIQKVIDEVFPDDSPDEVS